MTLDFEPHHHWNSNVYDHATCRRWIDILLNLSMSLSFHICEMWYAHYLIGLIEWSGIFNIYQGLTARSTGQAYHYSS